MLDGMVFPKMCFYFGSSCLKEICLSIIRDTRGLKYFGAYFMVFFSGLGFQLEVCVYYVLFILIELSLRV
ncbi:hypothetical protein MtrunA17_Chr6g0451101 [Medicago truncatula]|uniref:Transmembrane protein n=1 Tax=Medicago truncatula TaxID=3880 RepID=A0A396H9E6_MEDTR|nr:hypothetical protein MtrunA17_Chr6g0451101 [Medicago truncatula]